MANNEQLNEQRLKNVNCDLIIWVGERSFPAHRKFLRDKLRFFRNRIPSFELTNKKNSTIVLQPEVVDSEVFDDILQYAYVKQIKFTTANLEPVYRTADYLHFEDLLDAAEDAMKKVEKTSQKMLVLLMNIAKDFELKELEYELKQSLIMNPLSALAREHLLPALNYEHLKVLFKQMGDQKENMYYLCAEWVGIDEHNRARRFAKLLRDLPIGDLSFEFLNEIVSENAVIQGNNECLRLLVSTLKSKPQAKPQTEMWNESQPKPRADWFTPQPEPQTKPHPEPQTKPLNESQPKLRIDEFKSLNSFSKDSLFVIGGDNTNFCLTMSRMNGAFKDPIWGQESFIARAISRFGLAVLNDRIYICGGRARGGMTECMKDLNVFVPDYSTPELKLTRKKVSSMRQGREGCAMIEHGNHLYVAGGKNELNQCLASVERYHLHEEKWQTFEPMSVKRDGLELVKFGLHIYAIGGHDGTRLLNTFERYDYVTSKWVPMPSKLNHTFAWFGSAVFNNRIYIADGVNCEVFDPANGEWTNMPAPSKCVDGMKLAVFDNKLYAIGGRDIFHNSLKRVEWFDFGRNIWRLRRGMDVGRSFHGVAVIEDRLYLDN